MKHIPKERGIVDLVLSRTIRRHQAQSLSHLVIELKAPKVKIDRDEITQIEEYAISIQADARFKTDKRAKVLNGLSQLSCDGQPAAGKCPKAYALTVIGTVSTSPRADTAFDMSS